MRSILGRDAKGDVRLYAGREAINLWRRPTSGVDMRTESIVCLISIRNRPTRVAVLAIVPLPPSLAPIVHLFRLSLHPSLLVLTDMRILAIAY
jgi:hypothetical protein